MNIRRRKAMSPSTLRQAAFDTTVFSVSVAECAEFRMTAGPMRKRLLSMSLRKRRFRRNEDGSTAVEFALVIIPFLACLFAIIEIGLIFLAGQVLETAVADSSRLILTGQAQAGNFDAAAFKTSICTSSVQALFDCTRIKLDVRPVTSWNSTLSSPLDGQNQISFQDSFDPGTQCQIIMVRVAYDWTTFVRNLGLDMANMAGGKRLLLSTTAFRNEPYSGTGFC
jgi:Flp pilus assembly protein TadG